MKIILNYKFRHTNASGDFVRRRLNDVGIKSSTASLGTCYTIEYSRMKFCDWLDSKWLDSKIRKED